MISREMLQLLEEYNASITEHSGRQFYDHLKGTHDLLATWGNSQDLCTAGLFHSIYGTQAFKQQSAGMKERAKIRVVIGKEAEQLAYLFCACDSNNLEENLDNPQDEINFLDRFTESIYPIPAHTYNQLIELKLANSLEQLPHLIKATQKGNNLSEEKKLMMIAKFVYTTTKAASRLSPLAFESFLEFFHLKK